MRKLLLLMAAGFVFRKLAQRNPALARFTPFVNAFTSRGTRWR